MKIVNPWLVDASLAGLTGLTDDDEIGLELYNSTDPKDETQVKQIIREYLKPEFISGGHAYQQGIKTSLAYYLTTGRIDFERLYESCLPPFDAPKPARLFLNGYGKSSFQEKIFSLIMAMHTKKRTIYMSQLAYS